MNTESIYDLNNTQCTFALRPELADIDVQNHIYKCVRKYLLDVASVELRKFEYDNVNGGTRTCTVIIHYYSSKHVDICSMKYIPFMNERAGIDNGLLIQEFKHVGIY